MVNLKNFTDSNTVEKTVHKNSPFIIYDYIGDNYLTSPCQNSFNTETNNIFFSGVHYAEMKTGFNEFEADFFMKMFMISHELSIFDSLKTYKHDWIVTSHRFEDYVVFLNFKNTYNLDIKFQISYKKNIVNNESYISDGLIIFLNSSQSPKEIKLLIDEFYIKKIKYNLGSIGFII